MSEEKLKDEKYYEQEADYGLDLYKAGKTEDGLKHLRIAAEGKNLDGIVNLGHALKLQGNNTIVLIMITDFGFPNLRQDLELCIFL